MECGAECSFARPDPVEVRRRAAHLERPAGPEDHGQVDVLRGGDDAVVQHPLDLVGEAVLELDAQLLGRERLGIGRTVLRDDRERLLVVALSLALRVLLEDLTVLRELVQGGALVEALREGRVVRVEDVRTDLQPDQLEQHEGIHRHSEGAHRLHDVVERHALLDGVHRLAEHLRQHAVDDALYPLLAIYIYLLGTT